ncbi:hypothetical protein L2E82_37624 [Cichorium intybus]|uniref:Uncharacterized protein n=1 Tax=Cichorium intybus TaxID=13427 RepID=A0ACB9AEK9_CICIN|nr:hypothetical protein L2E82_37624 [Cichorium intybus]
MLRSKLSTERRKSEHEAGKSPSAWDTGLGRLAFYLPSSTSALPQMQVTPKRWRRQSSRVFLVINGAEKEEPGASFYSLQGLQLKP